jgi:hypothetical protein
MLAESRSFGAAPVLSALGRAKREGQSQQSQRENADGETNKEHGRY